MRAMSETLVVQGRPVPPEDLDRIRTLVRAHPEWSRRRLSEVVCAEWQWCTPAGRLKDMATRSLLVKLERQGRIVLPLRRRAASNRMASRPIAPRGWDRTPLVTTLDGLGPLTLHEVSADPGARAECAAALAEFHYLGHRGTVGENLQYVVRQPTGRLLACLLFGSAAWTCRARDAFVGWTPAQRSRQLSRLTNNTRFLILPFVRVPHLASWILGRVLRRLSADWQQKYGHPIVLVETFVDRTRFTGTAYAAANWIRLGPTTGRSRQDRYTTLQVPVKDVLVYPLRADFRALLCA
jgi:hypothetical protein